jgi:hypothetical protein
MNNSDDDYLPKIPQATEETLEYFMMLKKLEELRNESHRN